MCFCRVPGPFVLEVNHDPRHERKSFCFRKAAAAVESIYRNLLSYHRIVAREKGARWDDEATATNARAQSTPVELPPAAAATLARRQSALAQGRSSTGNPPTARCGLEDRAGDSVWPGDMLERGRGQVIQRYAAP